MKAIIQETYGAPEKVLRLAEVEQPTVGEDEMLVRVRAASMHADVWHVVTGRPYMLRLMMGTLRKPKHPIPGIDMAGVVEAVGASVTRFQPGDEVFGESHRGLQWQNGGAFADYVAAPEDALAHKPANITFEQAASVPASGYIAWTNMRLDPPIGPGQRVLINGAGGGVGSIALQLAKAYGAHVTGVDGAHKLEMMRSLGADHVIDYTQKDFTLGAVRYDFILDVASTLALADCERVLTPTGKYVMIGHEHYGSKGGSAFFGNLPRFFGVIARSPFNPHIPSLDTSMPGKGEVMEALRALIESGQITPLVDRTYPLDQVVEAIRYLESGDNMGKIIMVP